jgi:two-component system chemotaxis response regulator CheY
MKRALVADDSKTMREMVSAVLKSDGFDVILGVDGADALRALNDQDITVVATDYNMPNMNGVELVKALRANPKYKFTPIS